jgi:hypothetical protein
MTGSVNDYSYMKKICVYNVRNVEFPSPYHQYFFARKTILLFVSIDLRIDLIVGDVMLKI